MIPSAGFGINPARTRELSDPTIDPTTFAGLGEMTGADFVTELVDTFLEEAPRMLAELRDAHAKHDVERFRREAHSLKSNSNTFGALQLRNAARDIELRGLDATSPAALAALEAEYARAAAALKALCNG
jgi:HPt (histidine-containing phosphotransfer) domain-containing protein